MANLFDPRRKEDTDIAHQWALDQLYPRIFGAGYEVESVAYDKNNPDQRHHAFDCLLGVDSVVHLSIKNPYPERKMIITIQERFRDKKYQNYQDITITDGNNLTGNLSESSKLAAHIFLYGYVDKEQEIFSDAIAINVEAMVSAIHKQQIIPNRKNGNQLEQPFLSIRFLDLHRVKAVRWHMANEDKFEIKDLLLSLYSLFNNGIEKLNGRIDNIEQAIYEKPIRKTSKKLNNGNVIKAEDLFGSHQ